MKINVFMFSLSVDRFPQRADSCMPVSNFSGPGELVFRGYRKLGTVSTSTGTVEEYLPGRYIDGEMGPSSAILG